MVGSDMRPSRSHCATSVRTWQKVPDVAVSALLSRHRGIIDRCPCGCLARRRACGVQSIGDTMVQWIRFQLGAKCRCEALDASASR
jgi:hypothetical protein